MQTLSRALGERRPSRCRISTGQVGGSPQNMSWAISRIQIGENIGAGVARSRNDPRDAARRMFDLNVNQSHRHRLPLVQRAAHEVSGAYFVRRLFPTKKAVRIIHGLDVISIDPCSNGHDDLANADRRVGLTMSFEAALVLCGA